ncbi:hypothetical protein [Nesterenkonia sp. CF4.4]|uniref:hypothetical protein n=1 Tax=Nesterenkonia sp. CF4.4 TaxID=3373079 RepID=UPI003EE556D7
MFKEDAWRSLEPREKGLVLGVLVGAVLALLDWQPAWLAAGVLLGVGVGHIVGLRESSRHKAHRPPGHKTLVRGESPDAQETPEHREERLRSAAWFRATRMIEGRTDRAGTLEEIRDTVPGFTPGRYEHELDEALARIKESQVGVRARRVKLVEEAREMDVLDAVFALRYFNARFSGHIGQYGLGPIDIIEALGDLYPQEVIEEAAARASALISEGIDMGIGSWDHRPNAAYLRQAHPGFNDRAVSDALDWGHMIHR